MALTIAQAAGLINVGVVLLQLTFPLILVFILVGLSLQVNNAVSWSVTGRLLNGSWWPTILRTDTATTSKVSSRVVIVSTVSTLGVLLLAFAAILTPLGLYNTLFERSSDRLDFVYAKDLSPIGLATPLRDDYNASRLCGMLVWKACPGQYHGFHWTTNDTGETVDSDSPDDYISSVMPENLTEIFSSGRTGQLATVASPLDIQYRTYILDRTRQDTSVLLSDTLDFNIDQQRRRTVGSFRTYESVVLADDFVVRDGVVADLKKGGIGFRNHTVPQSSNMGAEWTESLLWVEPETACISNNVSLRFQLPDQSFGQQTVYLVDDGGLVALQDGIEYPEYDSLHTQTSPELWARAYKGATITNYNLKVFLNVSGQTNRTYVGRKFQLPSTASYNPGEVIFSTFDNGLPKSGLSIYADPLANLSDKVVNRTDLLVRGFGGRDWGNVSYIAATGGIVMGAPVKTDPGNSDRDDPTSNYSVSVFSCASILKAYVMDVTFFINDTTSLSALQVRKAVPRTYAPSDVPLWAIEKMGDNFFVGDQDPLWGLVDNSYENDTRLWTTRREHLYLPAGSNMFSASTTSDSQGSSGPGMILASYYAPINDVYTIDYSGAKSQSLSQKWTRLSQNSTNVPKILSLVWTDIAVNFLTSRRGRLNADFPSVTTAAQAAAQRAPTSVSVPVLQYLRTVHYRIVYAIPAFVFLVLYLAALIFALVLLVTGQSTLGMMRTLLNQTSVGRAMLVERHERDDGLAAARMKDMPTQDWVDQFGGLDVGIRKDARYRLLEQEKGRGQGADGDSGRASAIGPENGTEGATAGSRTPWKGSESTVRPA